METSRLFVSLEYHLRAEEPEPEATFHVWLSSRFGNCGRATRLFCRFSTSISSYRALLALSSEPASPLPIRHCVPPALQSLSRHLRPIASIFSAVAMRSSRSSAFTSSTERVALLSAERIPVHIYRPGIHSLCRQRAHHTLQAHIHLAFHQRFGNREVVQPSQAASRIFSRACAACC